MRGTEIQFELPIGYTDADGLLHQAGTMRLATAADEILPLRDPRVVENGAYMLVLVLARVITRLGSLGSVDPEVVQGLFIADIQYLRRLYVQINSIDAAAPGERRGLCAPLWQ